MVGLHVYSATMMASISDWHCWHVWITCSVLILGITHIMTALRKSVVFWECWIVSCPTMSHMQLSRWFKSGELGSQMSGVKWSCRLAWTITVLWAGEESCWNTDNLPLDIRFIQDITTVSTTSVLASSIQLKTMTCPSVPTTPKNYYRSRKLGVHNIGSIQRNWT